MSIEAALPLQESLLPLLECPRCRSGFSFQEFPRPEHGAGEFGILTCACNRFPVVDGIPIIQRGSVGVFEHTRGATEVEGIAMSELVNLIETGRPARALLNCLTLPVSVPLLRLLGWRFSQRLGRYVGMRHLLAHTLSGRSTRSACDLFRFFYGTGRPLNPELAHYFIHRFAQPRHLAALALVANVPSATKPVLDIACGAGHLAHYFTRRSLPVPAIGIDMNFIQLWIARFWVAPMAHFVCTNVADGLPFAHNSFSASVCSDAYHYMTNRKLLVAEVARVNPGGMVILTRVGNREVMPNEGTERTLQGYAEEFGDVSATSFAESTLVQDYLHQRNPLASCHVRPGQLENSKWLSFVWNAPPKVMQHSTDEVDWPHAVGNLALNPIFTRSVTSAGDMQLRFEFPSAWFAYENHEMLSYHPRRAIVKRAQLEMLHQSHSDSAPAQLVKSFILLGLPQRYFRMGPS
jgi:SAM-dependent methyltransferase/uncharacterized protein YbaR (Trm112 family)